MYKEACRWSLYELMEEWGINKQELDECQEFENYIRQLDEIPEQETCHNVKSIDPWRFKFGQLFDFECSKCGAIVWDFTMEKKRQGVFGTPKFCPYCGAEVVE